MKLKIDTGVLVTVWSDAAKDYLIDTLPADYTASVHTSKSTATHYVEIIKISIDIETEDDVVFTVRFSDHDSSPLRSASDSYINILTTSINDLSAILDGIAEDFK